MTRFQNQIFASFALCIATSAFAGEFTCKYSYQVNSSVPSRQLPLTTFRVDATVPLDAPSSGNLRAYISRSATLEDHRLVLTGSLAKNNSLSLLISDDSEPGRTNFASFTNATPGQVGHLQFNFPSGKDLALIFLDCSF